MSDKPTFAQLSPDSGVVIDNSRVFDSERPVERLKRADFTSLAAFRVYQTQLLYLSPDDPSFRISAEVENLLGLSAPAGGDDAEEDADNGVFVFSDAELVRKDLDDDRRARPHSPGRREVKYFRTGENSGERANSKQSLPVLKL